MSPTNQRKPKNPIVVPGYGPTPAAGMIIGEAPGRQEIEVHQQKQREKNEQLLEQYEQRRDKSEEMK